MFAVVDLITGLLTDAKALMMALLGVAVVAIAVSTFVKTRSTPAVLGIVAGGLLAFALLTQFETLATVTGNDIKDRAGVTTPEFGTVVPTEP